MVSQCDRDHDGMDTEPAVVEMRGSSETRRTVLDKAVARRAYKAAYLVMAWSCTSGLEEAVWEGAQGAQAAIETERCLNSCLARRTCSSPCHLPHTPMADCVESFR